MANQLEMAATRLYGAGGLAVSDFKMFPGSSRDATREQFAEQINKVLAQVEAGEYELVEDED